TNVTNMEHMFSGAVNFDGEINNWNTASVTTMDSMFWGTDKFNSDINSWDTGNVTSMSSMFQFSHFNQDISGWNTENVTDMSHMFSFSYFNQDIGNWNIQNVEDMGGMLSTASALSIENYSATLIGWANLTDGEEKIPIGISLDAFPHICANSEGEAARTSLIENYGWTIDDYGPIDCN
ncbi:MAG: BspA family leucine-rich repeat surface protein, partial [Bacteroidota bacterium]